MKKGFTFIEMIFVIVIMGILAKFGSEIFRNVYENYNLSVTNNKLQVDTESAIQQVANRLQYRIKNSVIARNSTTNAFTDLASAGANFDTLEWVGYDIDGWLGNWNGTFNTPTWSGFIDVDNAGASVNSMVSPASDFQGGGAIDNTIQALSGSTVANASIFFTGANSNILDNYGWDGTAQIDQNNTAAHLVAAAGAVDLIVPGVDDLTNVDVYEQYLLSWTAYALELSNDGNLTLYYDYQPWLGESYNVNGTSSLLMQDVSTFKFQSVGDVIKLQICIDDNNISGDGEYALCKEKAIF